MKKLEKLNSKILRDEKLINKELSKISGGATQEDILYTSSGEGDFDWTTWSDNHSYPY